MSDSMDEPVARDMGREAVYWKAKYRRLLADVEVAAWDSARGIGNAAYRLGKMLEDRGIDAPGGTELDDGAS